MFRQRSIKTPLIAAIVVIALASVYLLYQQKVKPRPEPQMFTPGTGILRGTVTLRTGNCMPTDTLNGESTCKDEKVVRKIYIHNVHTGKAISDVTYLKGKGKPVSETQTDENGYYSIPLYVGSYSVFVENNGRQWCNNFDGEGKSCAITLRDGEMKEYDIIINDRAAY